MSATTCLSCGGSIGLFGTSRNAKYRYNKARTNGLEQVVAFLVQTGDTFCNRCLHAIARMGRKTQARGDELLILFAVDRIRNIKNANHDPDKMRRPNSWSEQVREKCQESEWFKSGLSYGVWNRRQRKLSNPKAAEEARLRANARNKNPIYVQKVKEKRREHRECPQCLEIKDMFNRKCCAECRKANEQSTARLYYYKKHASNMERARVHGKNKKLYSYILGWLT